VRVGTQVKLGEYPPPSIVVQALKAVHLAHYGGCYVGGLGGSV
jgi:hypothetical protein